MNKILLQTTIPTSPDDWHIGRFSMLAQILSEARDERDDRRFDVVTRDRENMSNGDDTLLSRLDETEFDQLWLFGVDVGGGISPNDCSAIGRFLARGGGMLTSRDHQDLGISFCMLGGIGDAHHFHSRNQEPDPSRQAIDDTETATITWPNYHSGKNGDFQHVTASEPFHPVIENKRNASGLIERLAAHPHEGAVSIPAGAATARVIATGKSILTGRTFNLAIAFERDENRGRAIADSSFHHFLDYNLDPRRGCPSFVTEPAGQGMLENPAARTDAQTYFVNLANWLS